MNWRENIFTEIKNRTGVVILNDPNQIISNDDEILKQINEMGFEITTFTDSLSVRFFIENKKQESQNEFNVIILYDKNQNYDELQIPFDILEECNSNGGVVSFSLEDIFPKLSIPVVEQLDSKYFDRLFDFCLEIYDHKNDLETKEFLLQKIFGISSDTFSLNSKLVIRDLLDLHLSGHVLPAILSEHLLHKSKKNPNLRNWPLFEIISNSDDFFKFLQKEWENTVNEKKIGLIPFDDATIYHHLDNLFLIGKLIPLNITLDDHPEWMKVGIINFDEQRQLIKLDEHLKSFQIELSNFDETSHYTQWQNLSLNWASLYSKYYFQKSLHLLEKIIEEINDKFSIWVEKKYKSLRITSSDSPIMVHKIFDYLNKKKGDSKIALIVMDGMSLSQWQIIKETMNELKPQIKDETKSIFAWIPSITSISRQSIFSGYEPYNLKDSLLTTSKEEKYWQKRWIDDGNMEKDQVFYKTNTKVWTTNDFTDIPFDSKKILGLVINTIDEKMHSAKGGMTDLLGQIHNWSKDSKFFDFLETLLKNDFKVFLTSDHGNIDAIGIGEPKSDFADERGRRVRIYTNEESMNNAHEKNESKIWWPKMAGTDFHFLLPLKNNAFSNPIGESVVTHGADSFQEVIVPFVKLWWED
jgi:hypothetical protein